jgi:hypothetical protein
MQSNLVRFPIAEASGNIEQTLSKASTKYDCAEQQFKQLLATEDLDNKLDAQASIVSEFEDTLQAAISAAYEKGYDDAHLFLQRVLYGINRLKLFWYDDLRHYSNERSLYLSSLRQQIEAAWQNWELAQIDVAALQQVDVKDALIKRAAEDLDPPLSSESRYIREEMSVHGYCHLLAIASFDGLVEGSRLSRILGGAANEVQCTLVRVLLEEYGNGRLSRKHSTFFKAMMAEFGMNTEPEGYFDLVPWQVLACANHNFLVTSVSVISSAIVGG